MSQAPPYGRWLDEGSPIDCWVCYSSQNSDIVKPVIDELRRQHDIKCWDFSNIPAGRSGWEEIGKAMDRAQKILYFHSEESRTSEACNFERVMLFNDLNEGSKLKVIPVRLDDQELPRVLNSIQFIDARNKTPEHIARDIAFSFREGTVPGQNKQNGTVFDIVCKDKNVVSYYLDHGDLVKKTYSELGIKVEEDDMRCVVERINGIPWFKNNCCISGCCWICLLIIVSLYTGVTLGFSVGLVYTVWIIQDPMVFVLDNSSYSVLVCMVLYLLAVLAYWRYGLRKEETFMVYVITDINEQVNRLYNILLYVNPYKCCRDTSTLSVYKFDLRACKDEIEYRLAHIISKQVCDEQREESKSDVFLRKNNMLWNYLKSYKKHNEKSDPESSGDVTPKHGVAKWKCFCEFVRDAYEKDWWD